jgi:sugar phosphate permease
MRLHEKESVSKICFCRESGEIIPFSDRAPVVALAPTMSPEASLRYEGWRVAAASAVVLSFAAYVPYVFPLFLKSLADEFSWSRQDISTAYGINALMSALCAAPLGYIVDKLGSRKIIPAFLTLFGVAFASLSILTPDLRHFYGVFAMLGIFVTGILPVAFARTVCSWFVTRRGLALALAISGGSIGGFLLPPTVQVLLAQFGWRVTCTLLGAVVFVLGVPLAYGFIRERPSTSSGPAAEAAGATVSDGLRSRVFWTVTVVFFCSTLLQYGSVIHLSALLTDRGVSAANAAVAVSTFGAASLVGRLVAGSLLDRFFAARVAFGLLMCAAAGAYLLSGAQSLAIGAAAAFLIGVGTAGESDVVPYLLTRYFGLRSCSTLYGIAWIATALGAGLGPILMGRAFDATGSYETLLVGVALLIVGAATLMLTMPRYRAASVAGLMLLLIVIAPAQARAQVTTATLNGAVTDQTGAVLPNVQITATHEATELERTALSDSAGHFIVSGLAPGTYTIRAALAGFRPSVRSGVVLTVGEQATTFFGLEIGAAADDVEVVGTAAFVDLRTSALSGIVSESEIEALPLNGRNYISLALLQPGVSVFLDRPATNNSGGIELHINGAPSRSNSYLLDGANMKSFYGVGVMTAAETTLGVETVQEFRVVTNSFSSDYGRAMGGIVNIVSKSGSNDFHGSAFEFHRNSPMDARNFFDPLDGPPPFNRNQFGFSLGGPVRAERTFFFAGGEWLRERLSVNRVLNVPTADAKAGGLGPVSPAIAPYLAMYPLPNGPSIGPGIGRYTWVAQQPTDESFVQGRIDHNLTAEQQIFVRYTHDTATRVAPLLYEQFRNKSDSTLGLFTADYRRVFGSSILNTARFSQSRLLFGNSVPSSGIPANLWLIQPWDAPNDAAREFGNLVVGGLSEFGATATNPLILNTKYFTFSDDVSVAKGRHTLRFGALVEHVRNYVMVSTFVRGNYTFPNLTSFISAQPSLFNSVFPGSELDRMRRNMLYGFYFQDDFSRGPVTVNLGVRYETFSVPADVSGRDSALRNPQSDTAFTVGPIYLNPSRKNIGPRVGFAWDVRGNGRTSLRGGTGLYYDTDNTFNSAQIIGVFSPPFAEFVALSNPAFPVTSYTASPVAPRFIDYNIRQPKLWSYNANLQQQFGSGLAVMLAYAGSRGYDLVRAVEGNPNRPSELPDGSMFFPATGLLRQNPVWGAMDFRTSGGRSWYNALQMMAQQRLADGLRLEASYTLAKVEDLTQGQLGFDTSNSPIFAQNPYAPDRAPSDFDIRHTLTFNVSWPIVIPDDAAPAVRAILGGWHVNAMGNFHSGTPFTPTIIANWSRSGSNRLADRPNLVSGCGGLYLREVQHYFNPSCFALPAAGTFGNAGRNSLRGPTFGTIDLALVKTQALTSRPQAPQLDFRVEAFNLLNRANFAVPSGQVFAGTSATEAPLPTAGQITRTVAASRQLQIGVKVKF